MRLLRRHRLLSLHSLRWRHLFTASTVCIWILLFANRKAEVLRGVEEGEVKRAPRGGCSGGDHCRVRRNSRSKLRTSGGSRGACGQGFCRSTAWTAAATSEASSASRAVTAASARAVEEGEGKRAIAIEHHEAAAGLKRTRDGSAETAEANYAPAEAAEACSRQRAERAAS